jgi:dipeptidyl aminopeptidase/acylaminoacyl peptidase
MQYFTTHIRNYFLVIILCLPAVSMAQKEKVLVTDMTKIKQIGTVQLSPDASKIVYSLNTLEIAENDKLDYDYRSHLWLSNFTKNSPLTRGIANVRQASFSPDGTQIAFVRYVKTSYQIFIMPLMGGEAYQLTDVLYGASSPRWSPDGKSIVFSVELSMSEMLKDSLFNPSKGLPLWSVEKPGFSDNSFLQTDPKIKADPNGSLAQIRAYLLKDEEDKKVKVINRLDFQGEATTQPTIRFSHLMRIDVVEGATPKPITNGFASYTFGDWATDGNMYVMTDKDVTEHPDREQETVIVLMGTNGKIVKRLAEGSNIAYARPTPSPDGKWLAYTGSEVNLLSFGQLYLAKADGSQAQLIDFDRVVNQLDWTDDGKYLYFTAPSNGGFPLYRLDPATRNVERLTDFDSGINSFDVGKDKVVFSKTTIANPSELYVADLQMKNQQRLSAHNVTLVESKALSYPEKHTFKNEKGLLVEYWIMKPTQMEAGKKYPLLLNIHGGPTAMWGPGEFSMWHEFQYLCSQGYGIVYANPRGSGGYGKTFQFANYQDWGTGPSNDVLRACSEAAKESWADTTRQVVTGGSYAGYLTAWIISHDHRFKAAFAQRGVYDLTTFMGEGNAWRLTPNYFGYPWDEKAAAILKRESPYTYLQNINTPFLIKHGENDLRTGVIQSEMLYKSLKILNKPVEYLRVPGATHELSRSGNVRQRIDRMLRIYEFFERFVGR